MPSKKKTAAKSKGSGTKNVQESSKRAIRPYQWKKGQSGNPKGRPPALKSLAKLMKDQLDEPASLVPAIKAKAEKLGLDPTKTSIAAVLGLSAIAEAVDGNAPYAKELLSRIDGIVIDPAKPAIDEIPEESLSEEQLALRVRRALARRKK